MRPSLHILYVQLWLRLFIKLWKTNRNTQTDIFCSSRNTKRKCNQHLWFDPPVTLFSSWSAFLKSNHGECAISGLYKNSNALEPVIVYSLIKNFLFEALLGQATFRVILTDICSRMQIHFLKKLIKSEIVKQWANILLKRSNTAYTSILLGQQTDYKWKPEHFQYRNSWSLTYGICIYTADICL